MTGGIADPIGSHVPMRERADLIYLLLDGLRRPDRRKSREAILCALAIARDGSLVPLPMRPVARETERAWSGFLRDLKVLGVGRELRLVCCDDHPALMAAAQAMFPDVPLQISVAHRLLTLARKVDAQFRASCLAEARQIFAAPDLDAAVARFRLWRAKWLKHGHRAVNSLEADLASCLTFYRFPASLWPKIRTVNLVEREFRQARRNAPPAPADETDQEPAAGAVGPLVTEVPASAEGPMGRGPTDALEAVVNGHGRPGRRQAFAAWHLAPTVTLDRIFHGDPLTESLLTYPVPTPEEATGMAYPAADEPAEGEAGVMANYAPAETRHDADGEEVRDTLRDTSEFGPERVRLEAPKHAEVLPGGRGDLAVGDDYPFPAAHAHDLTQDADFMWWLGQQRQARTMPMPIRGVALAAVLGGLILGLLLARGL